MRGIARVKAKLKLSKYQEIGKYKNLTSWYLNV